MPLKPNKITLILYLDCQYKESQTTKFQIVIKFIFNYNKQG